MPTSANEHASPHSALPGLDAEAQATLDPLGHLDGQTRREELTQRQIDALMTHGRMVSAQIAELTRRVLTVEHQQVAADLQMKTVLAELKGNTEITSQIKDILTAGRLAKQAGDGIGWVAGFIAKLAVAGAAIWGAVSGWMHLTKP